MRVGEVLSRVDADDCPESVIAWNIVSFLSPSWGKKSVSFTLVENLQRTKLAEISYSKRGDETYCIDGLQEGIAKDIKGEISTALDTTIDVSIPGIREGEIFLLDRKLLAADSEGHDRELTRRYGGRKDIALLGRVVGGTWNGIVDSLAGAIVNKSKGSASISDGGVATTVDRLSANGSRCTIEHPEALGVVDGSVVGLCYTSSFDDILIDVAKGVEGFALVGVIDITPRTKVGGEKLACLWDVLLSDHVFDWSLCGSRGDGVDITEGETEEAITNTCGKLRGKSLGELDSLVLDDQTTDIDLVRADSA